MDGLQALVRHVETLGRSYRAIANVVPTCVLYGFILTCHFASTLVLYLCCTAIMMQFSRNKLTPVDLLKIFSVLICLE